MLFAGIGKKTVWYTFMLETEGLQEDVGSEAELVGDVKMTCPVCIGELSSGTSRIEIRQLDALQTEMLRDSNHPVSDG